MVNAACIGNPALTILTTGLLSMVSGAAADFLLEDVVTEASALDSPPLLPPSCCPRLKCEMLNDNIDKLINLMCREFIDF